MLSANLALTNESDFRAEHSSAPGIARGVVGEFKLAAYDNLEAIEPIWRVFQQHAVCTPFQTFEWLSAWQRRIGSLTGIVPCIVVVRDLRDSILFILPLAVTRVGFARALVWLGSELCDYNAPLLAAECSDRLDAAAFTGLWRGALDMLRANPRFRFEMVRLDKMPESIRNRQNPMLALPTTLHPSGSYMTPLAETWDAFYAAKRSSATRRRDRTKRKRLGEFGEVKFVTCESASDVLDTLNVLIEQKSAFFARRGIPNLFARPGCVEFFRDFALSRWAEGFAHISRLQVGSQVVAANFGLTRGGRYYYVLSSYIDGDLSRFGPGAVHLHELIRYAIDRKFTMFDFTVGDERYKLDWCDGVEPLHDHVWVTTWRGAVAVAPAIFVKKLKRTIKQSPLLWACFTKLRALAGAVSSKPFPPPPTGASERDRAGEES
jgi:CelD/BcsL family acetyltransferase involved in cellulose biosynthesis